MEITLNEKKYKLHFGIGFVKELDEKYSTEVFNTKFGAGVNTIYAKLQTPNPYPLYQALHAALNTQIDLTEENFDNWVDGLPDDKPYTEFLGKVLHEMETSPQTKFLISAYKKQLHEFVKEANNQLLTNNKAGELK